MGGTVSAGTSNDELIDHLVEEQFIRTPLVEQVFRSVDRRNYYTKMKSHAYEDIAWSMGHLHLSAPRVYATVMEALELKSGLSFLNLGSGSGYLSTMAGLILGPYGINHGVEIYSDNVKFATDALDAFIKYANAIDEYDFCKPSFFVGNCLLLDDNCPEYDRVYCSASCPAEYEIYIKNLVKVGGILIMHFNGQLLKIIRIGESTWSTLTLLSVSTAPLKTPPFLTEHEHIKFVKVDSFCPPNLKYICRSNIRATLRKAINKDYPSLKNKQRRVEVNHRRKVFSVFDEHGWNNHSHSESDFESDSDSPEFFVSRKSSWFGLKGFIQQFHGNLLTSKEALEMERSLASDNAPSSSSVKPSFDLLLQTRSNFYCRAQVRYRKTSANHVAKKRKLSSGLSDPDDRGKIIIRKKSKAASILWERITPRNSDSEMEKGSKSDNIPKEKDKDIEDDTYTKHMMKRIPCLPLPFALKKYLNYERKL